MLNQNLLLMVRCYKTVLVYELKKYCMIVDELSQVQPESTLNHPLII